MARFGGVFVFLSFRQGSRELIASQSHGYRMPVLGGVHDEHVDRTYAVGDTMARAGNAAPEIVYNVNAG